MAGRCERLRLCAVTHGFTVIFLCTLVVCSAEGVVEGFEGGAAVLPCTVSIQGNLRWSALNQPILIRTGGQVLIEQNTQWKDVISLVGSSNNLSISKISRQRDDGKNFTCSDAQGTGQQATTVRVLVRISGVGIEQASEGQVTLTEGTPKTLTCTVTGNPNPNPFYSWMVDDGGVTGQGSSYSLTADRSMRSVRCTATNKYSDGSVLSTKEATATLNALYLDTPSATTPVNVTEDETAILVCSAQGNPQSTFAWKMSKSAEVKRTSAVYRIENVQRSASGEYTCNVTNSVGSGQTTVQLVVQCE
ncbi:hemicentin-2-like [Liolophura sinensis]|uniref:hemicentin-2-like n=1 Tax=Liolophura sinensis TaxID=3198878 RepID=UPI00315837F1